MQVRSSEQQFSNLITQESDSTFSICYDLMPFTLQNSYPWINDFNQAKAREFCENQLKKYSITKLCEQFPNVNIQQEVNSCISDVKVQ